MDNYNLGIIFVLLLTVIALFLVIGILAICFWNLLIVLRQYLTFIREQNGNHSKRTKEKETTNESTVHIPVAPSKIQNVWKPEQLHSTQSGNKVNKFPPKAEETLVDLDKDYETEIMEFLRLDSKRGCIRLGLSEKTYGDYLGKNELEEDSEGKLVIYQKTPKGYIVIPENENISEKEYVFYGVNSCYDVNQDIKPGYYYRIVRIIEPCMVQKQGKCYLVHSRGMMLLERKKN